MSDKEPLIQGGGYHATTYGGLNVPPPGEGNVPSGPMPPQSLPPPDMVGPVTGYEGITFQEGALISPPNVMNEVPVPVAPSAPLQTAVVVSEDEARAALTGLASSNCCWGKKAALEMVITSITSSSAFHYKLDTFTEARKSSWTHEPYYGDPIDGSFNGPAPPPWAIPIQPDRMFHNHEKSCEVPHTACVKLCHDCNGGGSRCCHHCNGRGRACCNGCNGSGFQRVHHEHHHHQDHHHGNHGHHGHHHHHHHHHSDTILCPHCAGTGNKVCWICNGCGHIDCRTCKAKGQLKCYIKLLVIWHTHSSDHIVENTSLPDDLVRNAQGQVCFNETAERVAPVSHFPNAQINSSSNNLVQQHLTSLPNERILMQRHQVRIVPISEVTSDYKGSPFTYWVFGNDREAFAPDYPQQCCCGCAIL